AGDGAGGFAPAVPYNTGKDTFFVASADLNLDGRLDLVVANRGDDKAGVLLGTGKAVTQTALNASANPANFGQAVMFTATISDANATGTVDFLDGNTNIGNSPVANGQATLSTATLGTGTHFITAQYNGDPNLLASLSNTV